MYCSMNKRNKKYTKVKMNTSFLKKNCPNTVL